MYYDNDDITVELLAKYCKKYHKNWYRESNFISS